MLEVHLKSLKKKKYIGYPKKFTGKKVIKGRKKERLILRPKEWFDLSLRNDPEVLKR